MVSVFKQGLFTAGFVKGGRMIQLCVTLTLMSASLDSMPDLAMMQSRYSRQVLISSILGFTCTFGMGIFMQGAVMLMKITKTARV
jgi:hypothetical protein